MTVSRFEVNEQVLVVERSGTPNDYAFVLIHGVGMGHRVFRGLAEELDRAGTVYAIDLPGFGDSPEPPVSLDMPASGDLLAAFVQTLPQPHRILVGHSMGTQVVVEAVARHRGVAERVVLIAPTVNAAERTAARQAWRMVQDLAIESPKVLAIGLIQYLKAGPAWFIRKLRQMLDHRIEDQLPSVTVPALVLRGETDRICPRDWAQRVTDLIPDASMREVDGRGHEAMIRSPEPVASMIIEHAMVR